VQSALIAARWSMVAETCGASLGVARSIRANLSGMLFYQLLPGTVGGDAARVALSVAQGKPLKGALMGMFIDRVIALVVLAAIVIVTLPWFDAHIRDTRMVYGLAAVAAAVMAGFFLLTWLSGRVPVRRQRWAPVVLLVELGTSTRVAIRPGLRTAVIVLLAVAALLLYGVLTVLCAQGLDIAIDPLAVTLLMLPTLLVMAFPVSIAGWGVREGAMVVAFGQVGVSPADALTLSIVWGAVYVLAGIPGGVLWIIPSPRSTNKQH
jgi:uncharacterized membrane protein YbhN (UPF0104 family)